MGREEGGGRGYGASIAGSRVGRAARARVPQRARAFQRLVRISKSTFRLRDEET